MAKQTRLNFGDLKTWINNISSETAEKAAEDITRQLKIRGPYWTGEFEEAWAVTLGDPIAASKPSTRASEVPQPRQITPLKAGIDFPSAPKKDVIEYVIDNEMEYRDVAKDIEPGRIKGGGNETADQDWYETYIRGGGLATTIALSTNRVSKDPKIKNFKGRVSK